MDSPVRNAAGCDLPRVHGTTRALEKRAAPMQYYEPNFLEEALVLLERFGSDGRVLAGGTRLGPHLREGHQPLDALINLKRVKDLSAIEVRGNTLRVGALTTAAQLTREENVRTHAPLLAAAAASMGSVQLRTIATLGGNVCSGDPASDLSVALLACDARCEVATLADGPVSVAIDRLLAKTTPVLGPLELLVAVELPIAPRRFSYQKVMNRRGFEMALVAVAFSCLLDGATVRAARIALAGAAQTPIRATAGEGLLSGERLSARSARDAARVAATADARPTSDHRASEEYRRHLVAILTERAINDAATASALGGV